MSVNMTGGQRTAASRQVQGRRTLSRLRRHYRGSTSLSNRALFWGAPLVGAALLSAVPAIGNPTGGSVVGGSASIGGEGTGTVTVNQATDRAILHWDDFSIGVGETTQFVQPGSGSIALNRVTGKAESTLLGTLRANGNVWLVNPNGVFAGAGATIDVNGFLASTADILDTDFLDGDNRFTFGLPSANPDATVINHGGISVGERGLAALVAPGVENDGIIVGRMAQVVLGGTPTFALDFVGDGLLSFEVGSEVATAPDGLTELVSNTGLIDAPGGMVLLTSSTLDGVVDNVINMSGVIRAQSLTTANGQVVLSGGDEGVVRVAGTIDASGTEAGETGGTVKLLGDLLALDLSANIDVSGDAGGGTVLVGGAFQGNGPEQNAAQSFVGADAAIHADALTDGDGGTVIVWADESTQFYGTITATGGADGGDGGFVEVSGRDQLAYRGTADLTAPAGSVGTLLLDPTTLEIAGGVGDGAADGNSVFQGPALGEIADVNALNIVFESEIEEQSKTANIILQATNDIIIDAGNPTFTYTAANNSGAGADPLNEITLASGMSLTIQTTASTAGQGIDLVTNATTAPTVSVRGSGTVLIDAGANGDVAVAGLSAETGQVTFVAGGTTTLNGDITTDGGNVDFTGAPDVDLATDVTIDTDATGGSANAGNILFAAASNVDGVFALDLDARADNGGTGGTVILGEFGTGGNTRPTALTVSGANLQLNDGIWLDGGGAVDFTGATIVDLLADLRIDTDAGAVAANQDAGAVLFGTATVDGGFNLVIDAAQNNTLGADGLVSLGAVGGTTELASLTVFGGTTTLGGDIAVDGGLDVDFTGATSVALATDVTIDTDVADAGTTAAGDVLFGTTAVDGAQALIVDATATDTGGTLNTFGAVTLDDVGQTTALASLDVDGGLATLSGDIAVDGGLDVDFTGATSVALATDVTIDTDVADAGTTAAGDVLFGTTAVDGAQALIVDATATDTGGTLNTFGAVTLGGVGQTTALASLDVDGGLATLSGDIAVDGGLDVDFTGATSVALATDVTIDTDVADAGTTAAGDVLFGTTAVDGAQALIVDATATDTGGTLNTFGAVTLDGVGQTTALASLDVDGGLATLSGDIAVDGGLDVDFTGATSVALATDVTIDTDVADAGTTAAGDVLFGTTAVDGAQALIVDATATDTGGTLNTFGAVTLGGVGQTTALASLDVDGGLATLSGDIAVDGGLDVDFTGATSVALATDVTIDTDVADAGTTAAGDVLFGTTAVDGAQALIVDATATDTGGTLNTFGAVTLGGVGQTTALASLDVDGGLATLSGDIAVDGGLDVDFTGATSVALATDVTIDTDVADAGTTAAGDVLFGTTAVDGAQALIVDATATDTGGTLNTFGAVTLDGVGQTTALASLDVDGGLATLSGDIAVDGGLDVDFTGATSVALATDVTIDTDVADAGTTAAGDVLFGTTAVDGAQALIVDATATDTGGTLNTFGAVTLGGVGQTTALASLDVDGGLATLSGDIAVDGGLDVDFTGATSVALATDVTIDTDVADAGTTAAGDVLFGTTAVDGAQALIVDATATDTGGTLNTFGAVTLGGVGQTTALASLDVDGGLATLSGDIAVDGGLDVDFTGATSVALATDVTIDTDVADAGTTAAGDVLFGTTAVDGAQALIVDATATDTGGTLNTFGAVTLDGVGQTTALASLDVDGGLATLSGDIAVDGGLDVDFTGATSVALATDVTIDTDVADAGTTAAGDVLFGTTAVDGAQALIVDATATDTGGTLNTFGAVTLGGVGQTTALASLDVDGGLATLSGDIAVDGGLDVDFTGATSVALATDVTIDTDVADAGTTAAGDVLFGTTAVDGAQALIVDATATDTGGTLNTFGAVTLGGVGQTTALASLDVDGGLATLSGDIAVDGGLDVDFTGATSVALATDVTIDTDVADAGTTAAGDVLFGTTAVDGAQALIVDATATDTGGTLNTFGAVTLGGVGQTTALASLDVDGGLATLSGDIAVDGGLDVDFTGATSVALATDVTIDTDVADAGTTAAGDVLFGTTAVDGAQALIVDATATDTGGTLNTFGAVTLDGVGQTTALASLDVDGGTIAPNGAITTAGGPIELTATAGSLTISNSITSNDGQITLEGPGVSIASTDVDAGAGAIDVDGGAGQFSITGSGRLLSTSAVDVVGGAIDLSGASQVGGSGPGFGEATTVVLRTPAGVSIGVGNGTTGAFNLTDSELDTIRAQNLRIGDGTAGAIDVGTWSLSSNIGNVTLVTGASGTGVDQIGGPLNFVNDQGLIVRSVGSVELDDPLNNLNEVAADVASGSFTLANIDTLIVASLSDDAGASVDGISAPNGVTLSTQNGAIDVDADVDGGSGRVTITANGDENLLTNRASITSTGDVTLIADKMDLTSGPGIGVSGAIVTLAPETLVGDDDAISIGAVGDTTPDTLELSIVELSTVEASTALRIGSDSAGAIEVSEVLPNLNATTTTVSLISSGNVTQTTGSTITVDTLRVTAAVVTLDEDNNVGLDDDINVGTLGGSVSSMSFTDVGANLVVDGLSATNSVTLTTDDIDVTASGLSAGNTVAILPVTDGLTIGLATTSGDMQISSTDLGNISASILRIGNTSGVGSIAGAATAGGIDAGAFTLSPAEIGRLDLRTDGNLSFGGDVNGSFDLWTYVNGNTTFASIETDGLANVGQVTPLNLVVFQGSGYVEIGNNRFAAESLWSGVNGEIRNNNLERFDPNTFQGIDVGQLVIFGSGSASLFGAVGGLNTQAAAQSGDAFAFPAANNRTLNGCTIGSGPCFDLPSLLPVNTLDLSLDDERLLREPFQEEEEELEDLLSNTGNEELW